MSVSVEKLENSMAVLTIEVGADEFEKAVNQVYQRQKSRLSAPGFRKGKTPRKLIEKMYGEGIFWEDAANDLINKTYPEEAEACGEEIVSQPEIDVKQIGSGKPFIYTAKVALKPPVVLGQYKGVEVTKAEIEVTDEDIDAEIKREQDKNASFVEVSDRPVQNGDRIKLDFEGFVDGVAFDGGKGENYDLTIGSGSFIPGFEEQLVGAKPGEEMEVNVTFPENYGADNLAGKAAVFKCTVKAITEKQLPELNDEYADEYTEFDTMEEYRADVKRILTDRKVQSAKTAQEDEAVEKIIAASQIEIPAPMLETQESNMVDEFAQQLQYQGMSLDQYYQYSGQDRQKMMEALAPQAEKRIRTRLVLEQIAREENITATEEEYEEELKKMAASYGADYETVKNIFDGRQKDSMMKDIAVQKAVTFVLDNAVEVEAKAAADAE